MKRLLVVLTALPLLSLATIGCSRPCYMTEGDLDHYKAQGVICLEDRGCASLTPGGLMCEAPITVLDTESKGIRPMSLQECLAIALEQGTVGVQSPFFPGAINDLLVSFNGRFIGGADSIRVLALDPAITAADVEASLSKFDARWFSASTWTTTDRPVGTPLDTFQALQTGVPNINIDNAVVTTGLIKPLPTGGVTGITFRTDYEMSNLNPRVNPSYRPNLQFSFEQPLLQGYGVEINQLRASHPGSQLNPFNVGGRVEGILITRIRADQQRAEFERNVSYLLLNTEIAYWNLYGSYWTLYTREQALRQAYEAWKINKARYEAGRIPIMDFAQSRRQYELFRGQRIAALGDVLEKERQLRGFLNFPVQDGYRIVPADKPNLAAYVPDWNTALQEAYVLRPELVLAREDLKFRQLDLINQKNQLLPDVRFTSTYDMNGIGTELGGPSSTNALSNFASNQFHSWSVGLRADIPIGFRDAHAAVRVARLNLMRSYAVLRDQEQKAQRYLARQYRLIFEAYEQIGAQRAQRIAAAEELEARFKEFLAGRGTLDILLEAQRVWADALRAENDNIVQYNNALAQFQFAKGTLLQHDNIYISEGEMPVAVQKRAVEHEKEKTVALLGRMRPIEHPCPNFHNGTPGLPMLPVNQPIALPQLPVADMMCHGGDPSAVLPTTTPCTNPSAAVNEDQGGVEAAEPLPDWVVTSPVIGHQGTAPQPAPVQTPTPIQEELPGIAKPAPTQLQSSVPSSIAPPPPSMLPETGLPPAKTVPPQTAPVQSMPGQGPTDDLWTRSPRAR